jgi:cell filamentation protein
MTLHSSSGRYQPAAGREAESEPGSRGRVLRNKQGIRRKRDMDRTEFEALTRAQTEFLGRVTPDTPFTADLLRLMHREWLGELYEWAGEYRTVEMEKDGFRWPPAYLVAQNMAQFEQGLLRQHTPCCPASLEVVARRMADVHAELLLIHPFRDGNGRLARWLADVMALQAGLALPDYRFRGRGSVHERTLYLAGVKQGYLTRFDALTAFFSRALSRGAEGG